MFCGADHERVAVARREGRVRAIEQAVECRHLQQRQVRGEHQDRGCAKIDGRVPGGAQRGVDPAGARLVQDGERRLRAACHLRRRVVAGHEVHAQRLRPRREDVERPTQKAQHEDLALFRVERLTKPALAAFGPTQRHHHVHARQVRTRGAIHAIRLSHRPDGSRGRIHKPASGTLS